MVAIEGFARSLVEVFAIMRDLSRKKLNVKSGVRGLCC
jgi:hypothetical protein